MVGEPFFVEGTHFVFRCGLLGVVDRPADEGEGQRNEGTKQHSLLCTSFEELSSGG